MELRIQDVRVHLLDTGVRGRATDVVELPGLLPTRFISSRREASPDVPEERMLVAWLRIVAGDGLEGWYFHPPAKETAAVAWSTQLAAYWKHLLVGADPLWREYLWQKGLRAIRFHIPQGSLYFNYLQAIDIALWDLAGKAAGMSIAQMLGQWRDRVPAYYRAGNLDAETAVRTALAAQDQGFAGYKDHSYRGPVGNIEIAEALRAAVGPDWPLMHDPVEQYTYTEALTVGRELDRLHYYWLEEPFRDVELGKLKRLANSVDTPILALEKIVGGVYSVAQYIQAGACDIVRNGQHMGGITGMVRVARLAEAHGMNAEPVSEGPCFGFVHLQVDGATSNAEFFETADHALARLAQVARTVGVLNPPQLEDGFVAIPDGPGLGIELDRDRAEDATVEVL
jgi:L-alanine-DL-glutamate epimerase-like enolase superfamily enzyme